MRVSYQGEPGAYSEQAAIEFFGDAIETLPCESFDSVFLKVETGDAERGIIPIENSTAGSIHRNYDLLLQNSLWIVGEQDLTINHCLIAHAGVGLTEIRKVISHPQALAQCERHLRELGEIEVAAVHDTAGSVRLVRAQEDTSVAAIASKRAAEINGMEILLENFQDDATNLTRFLVVACQGEKPAGAAKTSIVFTLKNQPGSLFKALSAFALREINLTKIESRPLGGIPWEYLFYVDFSGSTEENNVQRALEHLNEYATMLRVLGSYPHGRRKK